MLKIIIIANKCSLCLKFNLFPPNNDCYTHSPFPCFLVLVIHYYSVEELYAWRINFFHSYNSNMELRTCQNLFIANQNNYSNLHCT